MISSSRRPLPDNTQHSQETNIHNPGGFRTYNPSKRTAPDPRGHWYWQCLYLNEASFLWTCNYSFASHEGGLADLSSSLLRFPDHTVRHTTLTMTHLDEWSARRGLLYLTAHITRDKHPCSQRGSNPQSQQVSRRTLSLGRAARGIGFNCDRINKIAATVIMLLKVKTFSFSVTIQQNHQKRKLHYQTIRDFRILPPFPLR